MIGLGLGLKHSQPFGPGAPPFDPVTDLTGLMNYWRSDSITDFTPATSATFKITCPSGLGIFDGGLLAWDIDSGASGYFSATLGYDDSGTWDISLGSDLLNPCSNAQLAQRVTSFVNSSYYSTVQVATWDNNDDTHISTVLTGASARLNVTNNPGFSFSPSEDEHGSNAIWNVINWFPVVGALTLSQGDFSSQPIRIPSQLDGFDSVLFDGGLQFLACSGVVNTNTKGCVFMVVRLESGIATDAAFAGLAANGAASDRSDLDGFEVGRYSGPMGAVRNNTTVVGANLGTGSFTLLIWDQFGSNYYFYQGITQTGAAGPEGAFNWNDFFVGCGKDGGSLPAFPANISIVEIGVMDDSITNNNQVTALYGALKKRYPSLL